MKDVYIYYFNYPALSQTLFIHSLASGHFTFSFQWLLSRYDIFSKGLSPVLHNAILLSMRESKVDRISVDTVDLNELR